MSSGKKSWRGTSIVFAIVLALVGVVIGAGLKISGDALVAAASSPMPAASVLAAPVSSVPLPDSSLTPGSVQSSDTSAICTPGWARAHRHVPVSEKDQVAAEYGLSSRSGYEIDHLIPLELGGSNLASNLWPEPYRGPDGARVKDGFENYLHDQVCNGSLPLATAQREIASNWYRAWLNDGQP